MGIPEKSAIFSSQRTWIVNTFLFHPATAFTFRVHLLPNNVPSNFFIFIIRGCRFRNFYLEKTKCRCLGKCRKLIIFLSCGLFRDIFKLPSAALEPSRGTGITNVNPQWLFVKRILANRSEYVRCAKCGPQPSLDTSAWLCSCFLALVRARV